MKFTDKLKLPLFTAGNDFFARHYNEAMMKIDRASGGGGGGAGSLKVIELLDAIFNKPGCSIVSNGILAGGNLFYGGIITFAEGVQFTEREEIELFLEFPGNLRLDNVSDLIYVPNVFKVWDRLPNLVITDAIIGVDGEVVTTDKTNPVTTISSEQFIQFHQFETTQTYQIFFNGVIPVEVKEE